MAHKRPPSYAITSVDHALRLAAALQFEGSLTVSAAADRLGVARSTAHRVLQMLVYRDFALQDEERIYRPGPLLKPAHSLPWAADLRRVSLPYLRRLAASLGESVNVSVRVGTTTRFVASVEGWQVQRVTSREGMVFPLHCTTTGMLHLASLPDPWVRRYIDRDLMSRRVHRDGVLQDVDRVRRVGFALNIQRSEQGLVAVGVAIRDDDGAVIAGLAVCLPSFRFEERLLGDYLSELRSAGACLARDLAAAR